MNWRKIVLGLAGSAAVGWLVSCSDSKTETSATDGSQEVKPLVVSMDTNDLVEVKSVITNVVLDIRYATSNNFTKQVLYTSSRCFFRRGPLERLAAAQKDFNALGYGIKIFDAYRPWSVQKRMWAVYPHSEYVADPKRGSKHNRGAAIDMTLVKLDGSEVLMPTEFDNFTEKAHRDYRGGPPEAIRNRDLMERVMAKHGFKGVDSEWWHFDDLNWKRYEVMDVPVE